jgi:ribosomal subunit interface protein
MNVQLHLEDLEHPDPIRDTCGQWATDLESEFPQTTRLEISVRSVGSSHETHVHVTGKDLEVAAHARENDVMASLHDAFEKARRQLRKHHDKQIFGRRRNSNRPPR